MGSVGRNAADRAWAPAPEARHELAHGREPWEYGSTRSPSPIGAAHLLLIDASGNKTGSTGKPRFARSAVWFRAYANSQVSRPTGLRILVARSEEHTSELQSRP